MNMSRLRQALGLLLALHACAHAQLPTETRPVWTISLITGAPEPPRPYITERIFPGLEFNQPVEFWENIGKASIWDKTNWIKVSSECHIALNGYRVAQSW